MGGGAIRSGPPLFAVSGVTLSPADAPPPGTGVRLGSVDPALRGRALVRGRREGEVGTQRAPTGKIWHATAGPCSATSAKVASFSLGEGSVLPSRIFGGFGGSLAVDLGTANTVVFLRGEGIVLFEPSVIAINAETNDVLAVGDQAREMIGRTPASIRATRPLRHGVITDFEITEQMLRHFIQKAIGRRRLRRPRVVLCVPSGMTGVERDAVHEATLAAGAGEVSQIGRAHV